MCQSPNANDDDDEIRATPMMITKKNHVNQEPAIRQLQEQPTNEL